MSAVGVDADLAGDRHRLLGDGAGVELGVARPAPSPPPARTARPIRSPRCPSSGSMRSPLPDSRNVAFLSSTTSIASRRRRMRSLRQSLASSTADALEIAAILLELRLEAREQRERIGGRAGEAGQDAIVVEPADLPGALLDDGLPEGHLAVAGQHRPVAVADRENGRAVNHHEFSDCIGPAIGVSRKRDAGCAEGGTAAPEMSRKRAIFGPSRWQSGCSCGYWSFLMTRHLSRFGALVLAGVVALTLGHATGGATHNVRRLLEVTTGHGRAAATRAAGRWLCRAATAAPAAAVSDGGRARRPAPPSSGRQRAFSAKCRRILVRRSGQAEAARVPRRAREDRPPVGQAVPRSQVPPPNIIIGGGGGYYPVLPRATTRATTRGATPASALAATTVRLRPVVLRRRVRPVLLRRRYYSGSYGGAVRLKVRPSRRRGLRRRLLRRDRRRIRQPVPAAAARVGAAPDRSARRRLRAVDVRSADRAGQDDYLQRGIEEVLQLMEFLNCRTFIRIPSEPPF